MFNLLRMDLYRIKRSKSAYVCLGIMLTLIVLCCFMVWLMETPEGQKTALKLGMIELADLAQIEDNANILAEMDLLGMFRNAGMDDGLYCCILGIVVTLFVCMDFQSGYLKNIMVLHQNRWKYVGSKLLTAGILNFCYLIVTFGFCLLINLVLHMVPLTGFGNILFYMAWSWLISTAFAALVIAVCILTRNTAMGILGTLLLSSGLVVVPVSSLMNLFHMGGWLKYTLYYNMSYGPSIYSSAEDLGIFGIGLVFLALYAVVSSIALTKQDI